MAMFTKKHPEPKAAIKDDGLELLVEAVSLLKDLQLHANDPTPVPEDDETQSLEQETSALSSKEEKVSLAGQVVSILRKQSAENFKTIVLQVEKYGKVNCRLTLNDLEGDVKEDFRFIYDRYPNLSVEGLKKYIRERDLAKEWDGSESQALLHWKLRHRLTMLNIKKRAVWKLSPHELINKYVSVMGKLFYNEDNLTLIVDDCRLISEEELKFYKEMTLTNGQEPKFKVFD